MLVDPQPGRPGHAGVKTAAAAVIIFFTFIVVLVGMVATFAEGMTLWERFLLVVINPAATISAAWAMIDDRFFAKHRKRVSVAASVAVAADAVTSMMLFLETNTESDGEIPLILAVPAVVWLIYERITPSH